MLKNVLITGSNGFIGASIAEYYYQKGLNVFGFSIENQNEDYLKTYVINYNPIEIADLLSEINPELILHTAGSSSVSDSFINPDNNFSSSVLLFHSLMEGIRLSKLRPTVILLSSAAVYGNPIRLPIYEEDSTNPISPYGFDKLVCENIAKKYAEIFNIRVLVLRLFSVFGKKQKRLLIWELFKQWNYNTTVIIKGTGYESRDYIYIDDLAQGIIDLFPNFKLDFTIINVAGGREILVRDIVGLMGSILPQKRAVQYQNEKILGNPENWHANISKFNYLINHRKFLPFKNRLEELLISWYNENNSRL